MKLKIAMLSTGRKQIPPPEESISAPETVISNITEELVRRDYQISLFAGKDSKTAAHLKDFGFNSVFCDFGKLLKKNLREYLFYGIQYELMLTSQMIAEANNDKYDLIHAHDLRITPYLSIFSKIPIIFTYHGNIQDDMASSLAKARMKYYYDFCQFVAISDFQKKKAQGYLNMIATVHHGIDTKKFIFSEKTLDSFLFVGRMIEIKAPHLAAEIVKKAGAKIHIGGDRGIDSKDDEYWNKYIEPMLKHKDIKYLGHIPYSQVQNQYRQAKALIVPVQWDEPFGLVMIEAMACGTPVVAFNRGSVPEIIKDGETGFICPSGDISCMVRAVKKIDEMPQDEYRKMRLACRKHVEGNFTVEKMVDGYEKVYEKVIQNWKAKNGN